MRLFYYYVAFLMLLICGCTSQSTRSIKKPSQLSKKLNPNHQIYHVLGDTSYILSHINTSQLLYIRKNQTATFTAKFEIEIILFENNRAIDTFWTTYSDADNNQIPKIIFTKTPINVYDDQILDIEINTKDLAKKNSHTITLKTNKNHLESNLFYLVSNAKTHLPITQYFIHPNDEIEISSQSI